MGLFKKEATIDAPVENADNTSSQLKSASRVNRTQTQRGQDPTTILVMGRSGSGKTQHICRACECCTVGSRTEIHETLEVVSHQVSMPDGSNLTLIDTPGFDNTNMSDLDIFTKIAEFLRDPIRVSHGITRIIYFHLAGNSLRSRYVLGVLQTTLDLFLNQNEQARLTILVIPTAIQLSGYQAVTDEVRNSRLATLREVVNRGVSIMHATPHLDDFGPFIRTFALQPPIFPPIFLIEADPRDPQRTFKAHIEASLGYYDKSSTDLLISSYKKKQKISEKRMEELEATAINYQQKYEAARAQKTELLNTEASLRQQLQEVKSDYAFLRSQVQARDTYDQEGIARGLLHLNKDIEAICQSISEYITDNWVRETFGRDPAEVTTLDAKDLDQVKSKLGHCNGKPSLVESLNGKGLGIEEFFDFSIRTLLCTFLSNRVFKPFHPQLLPSNPELSKLHSTFSRCYRDVQKREPQYMAGKWRSIAFRSLGNTIRQDSQPAVDTKTLTQDFLRGQLDPLLSSFFDPMRKEFSLKKEHYSQLHEIMKAAWEWNLKLKEEVITLGDYDRTVYKTGAEFDPTLMEELQLDSGPGHRRRRPTSVVATLALGLVCQKATGGEGNPKKVVLEKALVATESLYT